MKKNVVKEKNKQTKPLTLTMTTERTVSYNDEIKAKDKTTINGYIREIENNVFLSDNNSFYKNIPMIINYLCNKYYHQSKDRFHPILHGKNIKVTANTMKMLKHMSASAFLSNVVSKHRHQWRFKIKAMSNILYIGIWPNESDPDDKSLSSLHYPSSAQQSNYSGVFGLNLEYGQLRGDPARHCDEYCPPCATGDIIDMYLNMNKYELSFAVNNKYYGKAFDVNKTLYRAACCGFTKFDQLQLVFYKLN